MDAILKPLWLYLEIDWKDIWKPIWVDIFNWCDTYYLHVEIHPLGDLRYLNIGDQNISSEKNVFKNISKGQYHLIDFV